MRKTVGGSWTTSRLQTLPTADARAHFARAWRRDGLTPNRADSRGAKHDGDHDKKKATWDGTGKAIFRTKSVCPSPKLTKVSVRNFEILIDEPPSNHGNDEGAQPLEYMLASLAGCSNVIINKIAAENQITLLDMEIDVVGVCDTRGIFGVEPVKVPFREIRVSIRGMTRNTVEEIELLQEQLAWRCPVKVIIKESGSKIKETWDITYV